MVAGAIIGLTLAAPASGIVVGVNIDVHQDIQGPVLPNDFHIQGRIESGNPGANWDDPPELIEHIDDIFPSFNYTITPDLSAIAVRLVPRLTIGRLSPISFGPSPRL
jgi:hypothetical protein